MTWERGDLALCIKRLYKMDVSEPTIEPGSIHTVTGVEQHFWFGLVLNLDSLPKDEFAQAVAFRKIPPLTRRERDEFLTDLEFDLDVVALQRMYQQ